MNDLRRQLAPITDEAWEEIEKEAKSTLKTYLAARKLVDFNGPSGWDHSAVNIGRVQKLGSGPGVNGGDVEARLRVVQPLVELRVPFELSRKELDCVSRGATDADLDPLVKAAHRMALAEDELVFHGFPEAGIRGICSDSEHDSILTSDDYTEYPRFFLEAMEVLGEVGVGGPYAIAVSPETYNGIATKVEGSYPVIEHVKRLIDGPIVRAPALDCALVMSLRGGDFELFVGRDISVGYLDHTQTTVTLYLEESLTFRLIGTEAAVALS